MIVGILDSGLGAIAVLNKLIKYHKEATYYLYLDNKHLPYGNKNDKQLKSYLNDAMSFFLEKKCDLVIIACNTISTVFVKDEFPKINVITPVNYVQQSILKLNNPLILATKKTVESEIYNADCRACHKWASEIEFGLVNIAQYSNYLNNYENIVLACTHFSFIYNYLVKKYPNKNFMDSADLLAKNITIDNSPLKINVHRT